jgi:Putative peptidoglycan binding domain
MWHSSNSREEGKYMLARKLLGGLVATAAASVMIMGSIAPAQAATTPTASAVAVTNSVSVALNSVTTLPHCNNDRYAKLKGYPAWVTYLPVYLPSNYNCILETGNQGDGVWALQHALKYCHSKNIVIDGMFGPATYNALLQVQQVIGVTRDGIYGPGTRTKMKWAAGTKGCKPITAFEGF